MQPEGHTGPSTGGHALGTFPEHSPRIFGHGEDQVVMEDCESEEDIPRGIPGLKQLFVDSTDEYPEIDGDGDESSSAETQADALAAEAQRLRREREDRAAASGVPLQSKEEASHFADRLQYHKAVAELRERLAPGIDVHGLVHAATTDLRIIRAGLVERSGWEQELRALDNKIQRFLTSSVMDPHHSRRADMAELGQQIHREVRRLRSMSKSDVGQLKELEVLHRVGANRQERKQARQDLFSRVVEQIPQEVVIQGAAIQVK